jgi:hypothetical protein
MKTLIYTSILAFSLSFVSCDNDDDVQPINEEEVITTVRLTFTPVGGGTNVVLTSTDLDGDGPGTPTNNQVGAFVQSKTYNCAVAFLNEAESPAEDITEEVEAEAEDHQIFYQVTGTLPSFTYALGTGNIDANGKPIGLNTQFVTNTVASGTITVTLRHLPNKSASGVSGGDITNAGGSTDAQVTFTNVAIN